MADENMEIDFDLLLKEKLIEDNCSKLKSTFSEIVHYHPAILEKISSYRNADEREILSHKVSISLNFMDLYINYILTSEDNQRNFRCLLSTVVFEQLDGTTQYNIYRLTKSLNNPLVLTSLFTDAINICIEDRTRQRIDDDVLSSLMDASSLDKTAADTFLDSLEESMGRMRMR